MKEVPEGTGWTPLLRPSDPSDRLGEVAAGRQPSHLSPIAISPMTIDEWAHRLVMLVKNYEPNKLDPSFRNDYMTVLSDALNAGAITKTEVDLLLKARVHLEGWVPAPSKKRGPGGSGLVTASASPDATSKKTVRQGSTNPVVAFHQWRELYEAGRENIPAAVLETFLGRLPKIPRGGIDWTQLILGGMEKRVLSLLTERRFVGVPELRRLAKDKPSEFYKSAALDVLLERGTASPRPVWNELTKGEPRASELLEPHGAVVRSYAADRKGDAWFIRFLAESPSARSRVLLSLLDNRDAALRLSMHIVVSALAGAKHTTDDGATGVVSDWIAVCQQALEHDVASSPTASVVIGLLRLCAIADPASLPSKAFAAQTSSEALTERGILVALQRAESETASSSRSFAFVVGGVELYRAVQKYLRQLPVAAGGNQQSPERALRFERYMGRKEVIEGLISALPDLPEKGPLRDSIEVVLYNAGVRTFGELGQVVVFDVHLHEAEESGVLPGDHVVVTRPGRRFEVGESGIVLSKAMVRISGNEAAESPLE